MSDMREALEAAFDQHSDVDQEPQSAPLPTESEPTAQPVETPQPTEAQPTEAPEGKVRDSLGRFVPKTATEKAAAVATEKPGLQPTAQPATPAAPERAPVNVPPALREQWATLPQPFKDYTVKREAEIQQTLQQTAQTRQFADNFFRTIQPYAQAIQIETNGNALQAIDGLMNTASRLRFGMPAEKAGIIAHLMKVYAVDVNLLDQTLVGEAPKQEQGFNPQMLRQAVQQELAPLMNRAQQVQQQRSQEVERSVANEIATFAADPKNEFYEDVRDIMSDAILLADRQGYELSMAEAYRRACLLHPEISKIMLARQQAQSAASLTKNAQRARAASVSVTGTAPVGNPNVGEPSSVRDAIEAAIETHSRV